MSPVTPDQHDEARELEALFDRSAPEPTDAQLTRMAARPKVTVAPVTIREEAAIEDDDEALRL